MIEDGGLKTKVSKDVKFSMWNSWKWEIPSTIVVYLFDRDKVHVKLLALPVITLTIYHDILAMSSSISEADSGYHTNNITITIQILKNSKSPQVS